MIIELNTERLHLRKMNRSDSPSLYTIWSDPDVTKFMNITNFTHEDQAIEIIEILDELAHEQKAIRYTLIERQTNEIIGSCGFNSIDFENEKAEIGYEIAKAYWGKGYGLESLTALLDFGFHTLKLNRIEAKVEPANMYSIQVLHKLNFTFEGTLRQYEKSKGNLIDINMYSRLRTD